MSAKLIAPALPSSIPGIDGGAAAEMAPRLRATIGWSIVIALAYFAGGKIGLAIFPFEKNVAVLWPSPAIALAALLLLGPRMIPAVFAGCLLVHLTTPALPREIVASASATTIYCCVAYLLLRYVARIDDGLRRVPDVIAFLVFGVGTILLLKGVLTAAMLAAKFGTIPLEMLNPLWISSLAAAVGVLVITPALLTSVALRKEPFASGRRVEAALLLLATVFLTGIIFFTQLVPQPFAMHLPYFLFPPIFWAGARFGPREVSWVLLLTGVIAVMCTADGGGPFASDGKLDSLASLYLFIFVLGTTGLMFAAGLRQRADSDAQARESEAKYRLLVENQTDLVVKVTRDGRVAFASPSCRQVLGDRADEILDQPLRLEIHEEDRAATIAAWVSVWEPPYAVAFENRVMTAQGWRWLAWSARGIDEAESAAANQANAYTKTAGASHDAMSAVVATARDITERKRAEEQARQHLQQLAHVARISSMGEMASAIAHEINQPLTAIASYSEASVMMLRSGQASHDELTQAMSRVAAQAQRAGDIVRKMRSFVRGDEGQVNAVGVNFIVREVLRLAAPEARQNGVELTQALGENLPEVRADSIQMQQVLLNLVRNAMEAINTGASSERRVRIVTKRSELTQRDAASQVEIVVEDTGPGLSEEALGKIFEPFFTTKPDGMGIGLALSRSIVDAHQGRLWAGAAASGGAMFHVMLPAIEEDEPEHG